MPMRRDTRAFAGIRVADFSWVGVGPTVTKYLADHGAEVIRIESATYPEALRRAGPFVDDVAGVDRSGYYANFNSSKLGVSINLKHPKGQELARRLVAICDVVAESFTPGTMARFGLDYESLRTVRPDVIMISMPLYGSSGPWAHYQGYGHVLQAAAGFNHLTGWPDGPPIGTGVAYTDFLVPHFATIALIAALDFRRRTGRGQHIEVAQFEAAIHGLWTAVLDWTVNGREQIRLGNRDVDAAPHGCYRCKDGRYVVIACETEEHWERFKAALGRPEWCDLERMRRKQSRLHEQKEIDRHIGWWCEQYSAKYVFDLLQRFGVPCGIVKTAEEVFRDPQLRHRRHFWFLDHPVMGRRSYDGPAFRLSRTPAELRKAAPCLGENNEQVFKGLLGLTDAEYEELLLEGALE